VTRSAHLVQGRTGCRPAWLQQHGGGCSSSYSATRYCVLALHMTLRVCISSALGVACAAVVWVLLQVSLLASGRLMYHGSCTDMIPWFQTLGYTYTRGALILQTRLLRSACIHSCWCQPGRLHCSVPHEGSVKAEKVDVQCLITPGRRRE
jgi:hypothetical protein